MPACSRTSVLVEGYRRLRATPRSLGPRVEPLDATQSRSEPAFDGDQLELVVPRHVAAGALHERGHTSQQLTERRPKRLEIAAFLHDEMMPDGRPPDKPRSHRGRTRSGTV